MRTWLRLSAWLCLSVMLWTVALEFTHNHASQTEATSCSICVVAHSANPTPTSANISPVFTAVRLQTERDVVAAAQQHSSNLDVRGPPLAL
jgi:hypothetical protein